MTVSICAQLLLEPDNITRCQLSKMKGWSGARPISPVQRLLTYTPTAKTWTHLKAQSAVDFAIKRLRVCKAVVIDNMPLIDRPESPN
jgi:hypothetical protein